MTTRADDLINAWLLSELRAGNTPAYVHEHPYPRNHLIECPTTRAQMNGAAWDCDCWSEYTRGDTFQLGALASCDCGHKTRWKVGDFGDLPSIITSLDVYREGPDCEYWQDGDELS